jgi:hypothetical protein
MFKNYKKKKKAQPLEPWQLAMRKFIQASYRDGTATGNPMDDIDRFIHGFRIATGNVQAHTIEMGDHVIENEAIDLNDHDFTPDEFDALRELTKVLKDESKAGKATDKTIRHTPQEAYENEAYLNAIAKLNIGFAEESKKPNSLSSDATHAIIRAMIGVRILTGNTDACVINTGIPSYPSIEQEAINPDDWPFTEAELDLLKEFAKEVEGV